MQKNNLTLHRLLWLALLAPLFFSSYNFANHLAFSLHTPHPLPTLQTHLDTLIPLIPPFIIPYWSIDILYGIAFLTAPTKTHVNALGKQLPW